MASSTQRGKALDSRTLKPEISSRHDLGPRDRGASPEPSTRGRRRLTVSRREVGMSWLDMYLVGGFILLIALLVLRKKQKR